MDDSLYVLPAKADSLDYDVLVEPWQFHTPTRKFADLTALNTIKEATVETRSDLFHEFGIVAGEVLINNRSDVIALGLELNLADKGGRTLLPVFWEDNYVSLLPGEERCLTVRARGEDVPVVKVKGWNVKERTIY